MPSFDIVKTCEPSNSFRVQKIKADFDVSESHANEHFVGVIAPPELWNIGVIVGGSGTGKSTIAKECFPNEYIKGFEYTGKSVVDDMPQKSIEEITRAFYAVGFGSVPSWLKPYKVLSEGEKMRCDIVRSILERDFVVFDEFTSVVDRTVAQTACIAVSKAIRRENKKFIAVSCHYDILDWLQPDWVFDTNTMKCFFGNAHDLKKNLLSENVTRASGQNLGVITI